MKNPGIKVYNTPDSNNTNTLVIVEKVLIPIVHIGFVVLQWLPKFYFRTGESRNDPAEERTELSGALDFWTTVLGIFLWSTKCSHVKRRKKS